MSEISLVTEDSIATQDAVAQLRRDGLIHERDGFVWPSRAALRLAVIFGLV